MKKTHKNKFTDKTTVYTKSYRFPKIHINEVGNQFEKMLEFGLIQNLTTPRSNPVWKGLNNHKNGG